MNDKKDYSTPESFQPLELKVENKKEKLHHIFEKSDCDALWAAFAAKRPLLLRGDPGTGKSQSAKAIAEHLGWAYVKETITGSTELSDLHWHFDAIARLGEAQVLGSEIAQATKESEREKIRQAKLSPLKFLSPGGFWWAYDWESAARQHALCKTRLRAAPHTPEKDESIVPQGVVILLDEIDKAQPDLPNGLLETLGDRSFTVPYLSSQYLENGKSENPENPENPLKAKNDTNVLVVITTNEERELPPAFLRRCFVHTLTMEPKIRDEPEFELNEARLKWLIERGEFHFGEAIQPSLYRKVAELVWEDRQKESLYKPGLAEYIDLLRALSTMDCDTMNERHKAQEEAVDRIARYALRKELSD